MENKQLTRRDPTLQKLTLQVVEEMIVDEPRRLRPTMAVIDPYKRAAGARLERAQGARLYLALILNEIVSLDDGHRKFAIQMLAGIFVPE